MALKYFYISEANKSNFLKYINDSEDIIPAVKKVKINIKITRKIIYRDKNNYIYNN